jgi:hypothetical protein
LRIEDVELGFEALEARATVSKPLADRAASRRQLLNPV